MVLWLLGMSGAGKTTLGKALCEKLEAADTPHYLLDGDEVRAVFDGDLGFSRPEREANIKRIILAAYVLDRCGVAAVVCNIAPFQPLRDLARKKIAGYHEIYLDKDLTVSMENDVKSMYAQNTGKTAIVGVDMAFDTPACPDLVLRVDEETEAESLAKLWAYYEGVR